MPAAKYMDCSRKNLSEKSCNQPRKIKLVDPDKKVFRVRTHVALERIISGLRGKHKETLSRELRLCFRRYLKDGYFKIHREAFDFIHTSQARKNLMKLLKGCTSIIRNHSAGHSCTHRAFTFSGVRESQKAPTYNGDRWGTEIPIRPGCVGVELVRLGILRFFAFDRDQSRTARCLYGLSCDLGAKGLSMEKKIVFAFCVECLEKTESENRVYRAAGLRCCACGGRCVLFRDLDSEQKKAVRTLYPLDASPQASPIRDRSTQIPSGKHRGKHICDLTDAELRGMHGGWNNIPKLRKSQFFSVIEQELSRRGARVWG